MISAFFMTIRLALKTVFVSFCSFTLAIIFGVLIGVFSSYSIAEEHTFNPISYAVSTKLDQRFIDGGEYQIGGVNGVSLNVSQSFDLESIKIPFNNLKLDYPPVNKTIFKGGLLAGDLKTLILSNLNSDLKNLDSSLRDQLLIENLNFDMDNALVADNGLVQLGHAEIFMNNCNFYNPLEITYNLSKKEYQFKNIDGFIENLCAHYVKPQSPIKATCSDCTLFPVDKNHYLDSNYSIETIVADGIPGNQRFSKDAYKNLLDLYSSAVLAGHKMRITSGYRSYQEQQSVFESWVLYEMSFGKSRAQAESDANSYSALPGFSEHQLGTTVDISSLDCIGIETRCAANGPFWDWLDQNAYKYGFVMSYPLGKENLTGYIHEPWHYRFIGVDLAKEFTEKYKERSYLAEFLRNKKLY